MRDACCRQGWAVMLLMVWLTSAIAYAKDLHSTPAQIGLGLPLEAAQIKHFAITIFPDGRNLPPGQGSVGQGATLYQSQCALCHGAQGIEGPAARLAGTEGFIGWSDPFRFLRILKYPLLVQTVGGAGPMRPRCSTMCAAPCRTMRPKASLMMRRMPSPRISCT